jgi:tRNA G18 (ribose-2'-O)-methylase SpoU
MYRFLYLVYFIEKTGFVEGSGIQKKFVPWKWMFDSSKEDLHKNNGMILIASLIDKPTNLGGLARTCDVFSASELVIGSMQYVVDKQFTSLSTFAEKHVNISEVWMYLIHFFFLIV